MTVLLWCQMEVTKCRKHPVRCHLAAPSPGNLGTGFACIVGIPRFTEREKQKWQEGQNLILACRMNGKDSSVPTLSQGLARYPLTDHTDSSLPCRILALITRQEEKQEAREEFSYSGSNNECRRQRVHTREGAARRTLGMIL